VSYDVDLEEGTKEWEHYCTCGEKHVKTIPNEVFSVNHTSNTSRMWAEAGCDLAEFDGKTGRELGASLREAIATIEEQPGKYRSLEPSNGWGTYESTLRFLRRILCACADYPDATVRVSR
jgi:hypothetical protein